MTSDTEFVPTIVAVMVEGRPYETSAEIVNGQLSDFISRIAVLSDKAGAKAIGHIKAFFKSGDDSLTLSCTTEDGATTSRFSFSGPVTEYSGNVNAIVYGIERNELAAIVAESFSAVPGDNRLELVSDHCEDPHCSDPDCPDHGHRIIGIE